MVKIVNGNSKITALCHLWLCAVATLYETNDWADYSKVSDWNRSQATEIGTDSESVPRSVHSLVVTVDTISIHLRDNEERRFNLNFYQQEKSFIILSSNNYKTISTIPAINYIICKHCCALIPEWILEIELLHMLSRLISTQHRVCCTRIERCGSCKCKYDNRLQTQ